ncbi:TPA: hypothetical protein ACH3X1_016460 [Trebouxia sp. C0004]
MVQAMPGSSDAHGECLSPLVHEPLNNVVPLVCWVVCRCQPAVNLPKHTEDTNLVLHVLCCSCVVTRTCFCLACRLGWLLMLQQDIFSRFKSLKSNLVHRAQCCDTVLVFRVAHSAMRVFYV